MALPVRTNVNLQSQIVSLHNQLSQAVNSYNATLNQTFLVNALKLQNQISNLLLNATAMSTPTTVGVADTINKLS